MICCYSLQLQCDRIISVGGLHVKSGVVVEEELSKMHDVQGTRYAVKKVTDVKSVAIQSNWRPLSTHLVINPHFNVGQPYNSPGHLMKSTNNISYIRWI